jgi:hypothetical protein
MQTWDKRLYYVWYVGRIRTSNLAYLGSDEDVGPCRVGCGCMCMRGIVFGWYNTRMRYAWALQLVSDS